MEKIKTEIIIDTNKEKAWNAYIKPEHIIGWAFASDDWESPYAENDVRVDGKFLTRMAAKDKSAGFDFTGTYTEVVDQTKLVYRMDKAENESTARECEVLFIDLGNNQTKITVTFDPETTNPPEMQKEGWQSILNNYKKYVETH